MANVVRTPLKLLRRRLRSSLRVILRSGRFRSFSTCTRNANENPFHRGVVFCIYIRSVRDFRFRYGRGGFRIEKLTHAVSPYRARAYALCMAAFCFRRLTAVRVFEIGFPHTLRRRRGSRPPRRSESFVPERRYAPVSPSLHPPPAPLVSIFLITNTGFPFASSRIVRTFARHSTGVFNNAEKQKERLERKKHDATRVQRKSVLRPAETNNER